MNAVMANSPVDELIVAAQEAFKELRAAVEAHGAAADRLTRETRQRIANPPEPQP
jgi:hypothetical protein